MATTTVMLKSQTGAAQVLTANPNTDGSGSIELIYTGNWNIWFCGNKYYRESD